MNAVDAVVASAKKLAVRSGGHCAEGLVDDPTVQCVIDLGQMDSLYYDRHAQLGENWVSLRVVAGMAIIEGVNAVERFLAASRAHDVDAAAAELAAEVVMLTPGGDEPVVGRESVAGALRAVEAACDEFRHTHLLSGAGADAATLFGLVFEAQVGDQTLRGVDLIELDEHDRIRSFTVIARPMRALMALGSRMGNVRS